MNEKKAAQKIAPDIGLLDEAATRQKKISNQCI